MDFFRSASVQIRTTDSSIRVAQELRASVFQSDDNLYIQAVERKNQYKIATRSCPVVIGKALLPHRIISYKGLLVVNRARSSSPDTEAGGRTHDTSFAGNLGSSPCQGVTGWIILQSEFD